MPPLERGQEDLGHNVLGIPFAQPPRHVAAKTVGVPLKHQREQLRIVPRPFDDLAVAIDWLLVRLARKADFVHGNLSTS